MRETRHFCKMGTIHLKKVIYTYCDRLGINEDQVINKIDWDFFSDNEL